VQVPIVNFKNYKTNHFYDEIIDDTGKPRQCAHVLLESLANTSTSTVMLRQEAAQKELNRMGVTFRVYAEQNNPERSIPFDILPRIIPGKEWDTVQEGLAQRLRALNLFIDDIYHNQNIIKDGVFPQWALDNSKGFLPECMGLNPPQGIWSHLCGTDLVRDHTGELYVLEDNLRVPSGISYVLLNRLMMKRNFPEAFTQNKIRQVTHFISKFKNILHSLMPHIQEPVIAILTPGIYNSAYFEHSWLAQKMGAFLVEGRDLLYDGKYICMRTTSGLRKIDILYRRVDDKYIDSNVFLKDSTLGCPGMMQAFASGHLAIVNAPGTGVADDKVIYSFVPDMIQYYLQESSILKNVPTWLCARPEDLEHTVNNLQHLVVKPASESGGYGMLIGPQSTPEQIESFRHTLLADPSNYISQPTLSLSTAPTLINDEFEGRHVDLRPFIIHGPQEVFVLSGGLTRVALQKGSLVVNSSQGGGSKDTWIVD
jgi:uncharacterized circularly permuted ATP-grasp superfamily protein